MSKYDELCQAYISSRDHYFEYQKACLEFAARMVNGLEAYYKAPKDRLRPIPVDTAPEPDQTYSLAEVMKLWQDTFWHFGLEITLCERPDLCLQQVMIRFQIKKETDRFIVKLGQRPEDSFVVSGSENEAFKKIYDHIFEFTKETFEHGLEEFLENPQPEHRHERPRKIGFDFGNSITS